VFGLGWQVLWERIGDVVDPLRVRRAIRISVVAAVLALIAAVVVQVRFAWAGTSVLEAVVTIALTTAGVGLVCLSCFPTARPVDPAATINGRQVRPDTLMAVRWSVQPYLDRRPALSLRTTARRS
jgi:ABC-type sulfate transport system permease component